MTVRFNLIIMLVEVGFNDQNMLLILEEVIFEMFVAVLCQWLCCWWSPVEDEV